MFAKAPRSCFAANIHRTKDYGTASGGGSRPESALERIRREVMEAANLDVSESLRYAGVVTWNAGADPTRESRGMRVFVTKVEGDADATEGETPEEFLAQPPLSWVCDTRNDAVVSNIPRFLPVMLDSEALVEFRCGHEDGRLARVGYNLFYAR